LEGIGAEGAMATEKEGSEARQRPPRGGRYNNTAAAATGKGVVSERIAAARVAR
jgi:hypothetical protein